LLRFLVAEQQVDELAAHQIVHMERRSTECRCTFAFSRSPWTGVMRVGAPRVACDRASDG
jgi:hypothetical protein